MELQKILLRQHVGAPTEPVVSIGDLNNIFRKQFIFTYMLYIFRG